MNLAGATPLAYFLGGAGLAGWGGWLLWQGSLEVGCALIAVGVPAFVWGAYSAVYCLGVAENRWILRRLRKEIGQRPDFLVDPQDPDAVYVSLIPRENFATVKWTMSSDLLLLKLDEKRREILMEGDSDRYHIPAGAISVCEAQCFYHPMDANQQNELWMVRLVVQVEEGLRELLLSVGHTRWGLINNTRRRQTAEEMCLRIQELCG